MTDLSGNSYVENLCAPEKDPQMEISHFNRSQEEDRLLGIYDSNLNTEENEEQSTNLKEEVLQFPTNCPNCGAPAFTNMKVTRKSSTPS